MSVDPREGVLDRPKVDVPRPTRRHLQAYAFDPMSTRLTGRRLQLDIPFEEPLKPGPKGELVSVVDFDGSRNCWYQPVDLNDPHVLAQGGLRPDEADPRFHQQVVYAVAMSVIERFERFLGRRFRWKGDKELVLIPHAFEGRNAFFDPTRRAVLFGYFQADRDDPGPNLPGQTIFTCLSVDIVAHEVSHALLHRARPEFAVATNVDVFAWHEAFADLVALFHHFLFVDVVTEALGQARGDIEGASELLKLALEFGLSTGRGTALREALRSSESKPNPREFLDSDEPHQRGACFVVAMFAAYQETYRHRIADLLRIATGGTGELPDGNLHPDLVARLAREAVKNADRYLGMVVRAIDYLPVVDVTFGDVVRAIVTADRALFPEDEAQLRSALVEALRQRGIVPTGIRSLAEESLVWPRPPHPMTLHDEPTLDLSELIHSATRDLDASGDSGAVELETDTPPTDGPEESSSSVAIALARWAGANALNLGLEPAVAIQTRGFHVAYRQAADRQPRPEIVVQFLQRRRDLEDASLPEKERVPIRAGTTVIAGVDGRVKRVIAKPLPRAQHDGHEAGQPVDAVIGSPGPAVLPAEVSRWRSEQEEFGTRRLAQLRAWIDRLQDDDPLAAWLQQPAVSRLTFASLHAEDGV
jgi:hypothetical protein